jgi:hypothetical protein
MKLFEITESICTFALETFAKAFYLARNNTPLMPLSEAHLGGFFFLGL